MMEERNYSAGEQAQANDTVNKVAGAALRKAGIPPRQVEYTLGAHAAGGKTLRWLARHGADRIRKALQLLAEHEAREAEEKAKQSE